MTKPDYLVENLRGMCAFSEPYGRCEQSRELRDFCAPCAAAAEIERLRAPQLDALRLAKEATNGWACHAIRKMEHDEIARLHRDIATLEGRAPQGPTAGDLMLAAMDRWAEHAEHCEVADCAECDARINQFRLSRKVWQSSAHKSLALRDSREGV